MKILMIDTEKLVKDQSLKLAMSFHDNIMDRM